MQQRRRAATGAAEALQAREPERRGGHRVDVVGGTRRDERGEMFGARCFPRRIVPDCPHG